MSRAKCFLLFLAIVVVIIAALAAYFWSGSYNVAANAPHWGITRWMLEQVRDRSITAHSRNIAVPSLDETAMEKVGFDHFHPMCRQCHGAPGFPRSEAAEGLYPNPPDLSSGKVQSQRRDAGLYWIIKNGLKMTGMPSFGATHEEKDLWGIVAFVKRLPKLSAQDYASRVEAAEHEEGGEEGHHDEEDHHGSHPHDHGDSH